MVDIIIITYTHSTVTYCVGLPIVSLVAGSCGTPVPTPGIHLFKMDSKFTGETFIRFYCSECSDLCCKRHCISITIVLSAFYCK